MTRGAWRLCWIKAGFLIPPGWLPRVLHAADKQHILVYMRSGHVCRHDKGFSVGRTC